MQSWKTPRCWSLLAIILLTLIGFFSNWGLSIRGKPYENGDEIATYNTSFTWAYPSSTRVYAYGSLDTGQQILANYWYSTFDPIGRIKLPRLSYSNSVPESFSKSDLMYGPRFWEGIEYSYFRGANDRESVFISRKIHVLLLYTALIFLEIILIFKFETAGFLVSLMLLCFTLTPTFLEHVIESKPSAQNVIFVCLTVTTAALAIRKSSEKWLWASLAIFVTCMNLKVDAFVFFMAPIAALGWLCLKKVTPHSRIKLIAQSALIVLISLIVEKPTLLWRPVPEFRQQLNTLVTVTTRDSHRVSGLFKATPVRNYELIRDFADGNFFLPLAKNSSWGLMLGFSIFVISSIVMIKKRRFELLLFPVLGFLDLFAIVRNALVLYDWYFLYGWALMFMSAGWAAYLLIENMGQSKRRVAVTIMVLAIMPALGPNLYANYRDNIQLQAEYSAFQGLSPQHNRNKAVIEVIEQISHGGYSHKVLVDQHGYTELRHLVLKGLEPVYINKYNFAQVTKQLKESEHLPVLAVFVPGTYVDVPDWVGHWNDREQGLYLQYSKFMHSLPLIKKFEGQTAFHVLDIQALTEDNEVLVLALPVNR